VPSLVENITARLLKFPSRISKLTSTGKIPASSFTTNWEELAKLRETAGK